MGVTKSYSKGEVIFNKGVFELSMYRVVTGKVGIYDNYGEANEQLLTEVVEKGIFGEMGLIDYMSRSATAVALEDSEVIEIKEDEFNELVENDPTIYYRLINSVGACLVDISEKYSAVCNDIKEYIEIAEENRPKTLVEKIKLWRKEAKASAATEKHYKAMNGGV